MFAHILANLQEVNGPVWTYRTQLAYLSAASGPADQPAERRVDKSPKQWQNWFWVCLGGMVLFIPTIWLNRGRWSPARAREDERKHEADVEAELKQLVGANA